jgi:hypothetical protein
MGFLEEWSEGGGQTSWYLPRITVLWPADPTSPSEKRSVTIERSGGASSLSKPEVEIRVELARQTVYCRMSGIFNEQEMRAWAQQYRKATDSFRGRSHLVLADMRGMKPTHPQVATILGDEIGYARQHGCVRCAHLSDDSVQRMQASRVARMASAGDDVTVVVATVQEAERVLEEARRELAANRPITPAGLVAAAKTP